MTLRDPQLSTRDVAFDDEIRPGARHPNHAPTCSLPQLQEARRRWAERFDAAFADCKCREVRHV